MYGLSEPILPLFSPCKTVNAKFYTPTVKQLPIFSSFFNLKCEANGKQCDFSFFLPFFFIYCISILYGLLVLLFVFPLIVLTSDTNNSSGKSTAKGYIWAALANHLKLVHFFYENGSRSRKILTGYLREDYRGAIQSDGLGNYKIIEKEAYPDAIRLSCFQHCKRKFLNITGNKDAEKIVRIINRLYQNEHRIPPDWTASQILDYRNKYAPPILKELKEELINIKNKKSTLPKSELSKAINYTLNEYDALCNYIRSADYAPDNNAIERLMRYISLSRRNSLFCGSHQGAKRAALIYSLACSCRLNNINSFEYFKDLLTKLIDINPNTDHETIRNLLPHKWQR